jgi:hypothetical protein
MRGFRVIFVLACLPGCTHMALERSSINQASTLTDLQYQQVMDNLAMFSVNHYTLPWHVVPTVGTAQIQDSAQVMPSFTFVPNVSPALSQSVLALQGSRQIQESWTLIPAVYNTAKPPSQSYQIVLFEIRDIYRFLIGDTDFTNPAQLKKHVQTYNLMPGWFGVGKRKDVPKKACYVAHCKGCYVWVCPENFEGLANTTLALLDIMHATGGNVTFNAVGTNRNAPPIVVPASPPVVPPPQFLSPR